MKLTCSNCGNIIENIPTFCDRNIHYNENKKQFECDMGGNCGYMKIDKILCANCAQEC